MAILRKILMLLNREVPTETLINRGMKVGENFNRQQGCFLDPTHCYLITIGNDVTMSIRVIVMAHDASQYKEDPGIHQNWAGIYWQSRLYWG